MHLRIGAVACSIVLASAVNLMAQEKLCSLLTAAEVSAAMGSSSKAGVESEMPVPGAPGGATMKMCSWPAGPNAGGLHLSVGRMDSKVSFDSLVKMSFQTYDQLQAQGWTEEKKDFNGVKCLAAKPPAAKAKGAPLTTTCMAEAKGMFLDVTTMTTSPVAMEKVKTLMDSAIGRL